MPTKDTGAQYEWRTSPLSLASLYLCLRCCYRLLKAGEDCVKSAGGGLGWLHPADCGLTAGPSIASWWGPAASSECSKDIDSFWPGLDWTGVTSAPSSPPPSLHVTCFIQWTCCSQHLVHWGRYGSEIWQIFVSQELLECEIWENN